jgi:hypothetical protein
MMELIATRLTIEATKDLKAAKFLAELTNNFQVPLPEELGVIYLTRNQARYLDQLEHAFEVWGQEYAQKDGSNSSPANKPAQSM